MYWMCRILITQLGFPFMPDLFWHRSIIDTDLSDTECDLDGAAYSFT